MIGQKFLEGVSETSSNPDTTFQYASGAVWADPEYLVALRPKPVLLSRRLPKKRINIQNIMSKKDPNPKQLKKHRHAKRKLWQMGQRYGGLSKINGIMEKVGQTHALF